MDLSTTYIGFKLPHPLIVGASPLSADVSSARRLEEAGAAALVVHSLFEEQMTAEEIDTAESLQRGAESFGEARSYMTTPPEYRLGPDEYLEHLRKLKAAVRIPVIASLNGTTPGGWVDYAKQIEQAGADALELNLYELATDLDETGAQIEERSIQVVTAIKKTVKIPVAVKISPFYSSIANFARRLDQASIDGLVLFNRFYQPDIDLEQLEVVRVNLSSVAELPLRLRWLAILSGRVNCSLAATGGVETGTDVLKCMMSGANAVQVVASLLRHGPGYLKALRQQMVEWMEKNEYESIKQMQGSMNLLHCPDPKAYERANYVRILHSWTGSV